MALAEFLEDSGVVDSFEIKEALAMQAEATDWDAETIAEEVLNVCRHSFRTDQYSLFLEAATEYVREVRKQ